MHKLFANVRPGTCLFLVWTCYVYYYNYCCFVFLLPVLSVNKVVGGGQYFVIAGNRPVCNDKLASMVIAGAKMSAQSFSRETDNVHWRCLARYRCLQLSDLIDSHRLLSLWLRITQQLRRQRIAKRNWRVNYRINSSNCALKLLLWGCDTLWSERGYCGRTNYFIAITR